MQRGRLSPALWALTPIPPPFRGSPDGAPALAAPGFRGGGGTAPDAGADAGGGLQRESRLLRPRWGERRARLRPVTARGSRARGDGVSAGPREPPESGAGVGGGGCRKRTGEGGGAGEGPWGHGPSCPRVRKPAWRIPAPASAAPVGLLRARAAPAGPAGATRLIRRLGARPVSAAPGWAASALPAEPAAPHGQANGILESYNPLGWEDPYDHRVQLLT